MATPENVRGIIDQLRVNELGTGFGPPDDFLDAEVIALIRGRDGAFGLQLRIGDHLPVRQAMFDLLKDAYTCQTEVLIDYIQAGVSNGIVIRVTLI